MSTDRSYPGCGAPHDLAILPLPGPGLTAHNGAYVVPRAAIGKTHAASSLDYLVGAHENRVGNLDAERFRGFQVHDEFKLGRLLDDGVIDPRDTRNVLGFALSICTENRKVNPIQFGVARP